MKQSFRNFAPAPEVDYTLREQNTERDITETYWYWARKAAPTVATNLNLINLSKEESEGGTLFVARLSDGSVDLLGTGKTVDGACIMRSGVARYELKMELDDDFGRGVSLSAGPQSLIATVEDKTVDLALSHWLGPEDIDLGQIAFEHASAATQDVLVESWMTMYQKIMGHLLIEHVQ